MAAEEQTNESDAKKSGGSMKMIIWLVVVVAAIGGGFATPLLVAQLTKPSDKTEQVAALPDPNEEAEFIDFDEIVAVLGKSRFSRYLKLNLSLQVGISLRAEVEQKMTARKAVLKNRIIALIAEISTEDLEGQFGHNRLRRQIHAIFNEVLFDDGIERIQDVLFRELQVQ